MKKMKPSFWHPPGLLWWHPGKIFLLLLLILSAFNKVEASPWQVKEINVSGKVTDSLGNPVSNVSVTASSGNGTSTNTQGDYSIMVDEKGRLTFSSIGYTTQTVDVNGRTTVNIRLSDVMKGLDEVVVVGYGTQKKTNATGAVVQIDNKVLEDRPIVRLSQGLQGAVANLNISTSYGGGAPNSTQSFNIRGYTGFGVSGGPLVVIDGVQAGDINAVNPNDVESITVVKDAASSAIYGSSAPYGVIIITTKKGKSGKPTITYNNNFTISSPIGMPKMLNSLDFADIYNEAAINAGQQPFSYFSEEVIRRMKDYQAGIITSETQPNPNAGVDEYLGWFGGNANNDWFKIFYKDAQVMQQHNLSISGGSEKNKYFVGLGYNDRPGILKYGNDLYRRYNVRANLSSKFTNWLEMNFRSSYSKETFDGPWSGGSRTGGNWMHQIARKHPNVPLYLPDGKTFSEISDVPLQLYGGRQLESWDKPQITGEFVIRPLKGWSATVNYTYEVNIWNNSNHKKTVYVPTPSGAEKPIDWTFPNEFSRSTGFQYHHVLNAFSSYEKSLGDHNFKILGGYVRELNDNTSFWGGNNNLYTDNIPSISTTYGTKPYVGDGKSQLASEGYFGRFNYDFDNKYLLELVGRYDGTSRFLADDRWGFYPGISAGWNIHRENFWESLGADRLINTFKIRGSYGSLGDQAALGGDWYPFYPALGTSAPTNTNWYFVSGREAATRAPGLVNPNITWVTTSTLDFGLDATFLDNRLSLIFDWYKRSAKDYLGPARVLPAILGTGVPQENVSAIETKGFELTLQWKDRMGNLGYSLRGILSNYKGVVKKFPNEQRLISNWYEGEVMGSIYGYTTVGYFKSDADVQKSASQAAIYSQWGPGDIKYADINGDGKIDWGNNTVDNMGDRKVIGNSTPQYQFSLFGDFTWKNFDASFFIQGVGKRETVFGSGTNYFWGITGSEWQSSPFTVHMDRWTPSNPNGYFPKFYMSGENGKNMQAQTKYMQNTAYARLKSVQIGYTFPQKLFNGISLEKLRVFALVENLLTISPMKKHSTIDPEIYFSDVKIYPLQRSISFGASVTF